MAIARGIIASAVAVVLAVALAIAAGAAPPNTHCALTTPVEEVRSLSGLPPELVKLIGPIADIGAPFNSTDSVNDPNLPFRRLIRAGHRGDDWFAWYEQGGIAYYWKAIVVRIAPDRQITALANATTVSDTLCAITDGAYAGSVPPYPPGAYASTGY